MSETEPVTAQAVADYTPVPRYGMLLKIALIFATLMQVLDMTIANVALPHMRSALGADQDTISWVLTSYIVASAIALPITGWLADKIGRRTLYLWSIGTFVLASMLCGVAVNVEEMVAFRIFQGISGAFLSPLAQTILLDTTPPEKRGQAMAFFGAGVVLGPIIGPILGSWLTESFNWRWVFFINVPLGGLAFASLWFLLPDVKRPARSLDITGFLLLAIGLAALQLMLDRGQHLDWFASLEIWLELLVALCVLWIFGVHLATAKNGLFSRTILTDRNLIIGSIILFAMGMVLTSMMVLLPIMLQGVLNYPVIDSGYLMASRGAGVLLMMGLSGWLINHLGPRILIASGFFILAVGLWDMTFWNFDISQSTIALNGFAQGMGMGMVFVPATTMAFVTLPAQLRTDASGILNLSRSIGSSIGISLSITFLARNTSASHASLTEYLTPYTLWIDPRLMAGSGDMLQGALAMADMEVIRQATMIAFLNDYYFLMWVSFAIVPLVFLIKTAKNGGTEKP